MECPSCLGTKWDVLVEIGQGESRVYWVGCRHCQEILRVRQRPEPAAASRQCPRCGYLTQVPPMNMVERK